MKDIKVYIDASTDATLTVKEVWPDGDAPENPTANDVIEAMQKSGSIRQMLEEWNLMPETVFVRVTDGKSESSAQW